MTEWVKINEQYAALLGYEDFISADGKLCKRVWDDGEEEIHEISESAIAAMMLRFLCGG